MQFPAQAPGRGGSQSLSGRRGARLVIKEAPPKRFWKGSDHMLRLPNSLVPFPASSEVPEISTLGGRTTSGLNVYPPRSAMSWKPGDSGLSLYFWAWGWAGQGVGGQHLHLRCQLLPPEFSVWMQGWSEHAIGGVCSEGPQTGPHLPAASTGNSVVTDSGPGSEARSTGFPGGSMVKNPPAKAGDTGLIPDLGATNPLPHIC